MRVRSLQFFCIVGLLLAACGGKKKDSDGPDNTKKGLLGLTDSDRQKFDKWKTSLVKSCEVNDAFSEERSQRGPIDAKVFYEITDHSLVISEKPDTFAIFGFGTYDAGNSQSTFDRKKQYGDKAEDLRAKFVRTGLLCEVYLFDEKVYSTHLYRNIPLVANWYPSKLIKSPLHVKGAIRPLNDPKFAKLQEHAYDRVITDNFLPDANGYDTLAKFFKISLEESKRLFRSTNTFPHEYSATIAGAKEILPFNESVRGLYATKETIAGVSKLEDPVIDMMIRIPKVDMDGFNNSKDLKYNFHVKAHLNPVKFTSDDEIEYSLRFIESAIREPFDDKKAVQCFLDRRNFFDQSMKSKMHNFGFTAASCYSLSGDFEKAFLNSKDAKLELAKTLSLVLPAQDANYHGWDYFFRRLVKRLHSESRDINIELNADMRLAMIDELARNLVYMTGQIKRHPNLKNMSEQLADNAVTWALKGQTASFDDINQIFVLSNKMVEQFPVSTKEWLGTLQNTPKAQKQDVDFINSVSSGYLDLVKNIKTQALKLELDEWFKFKFEHLIQNAISESTLRGWKDSLDAIERFKARESGRVGDNNVEKIMHKTRFISLAIRGLEERWNDRDFGNLEIIAQVSKFQLACRDIRDVSSQWNCKSPDSYSKRPVKLMFDGYMNRYVDLAKDFMGYLGTLKDTDLSIRFKLSDMFFEPVWRACSNDMFKEKAGNLRKFMQLRKDLKDISEKTQLDLKITNLLDECS